MDIPDKKEIFLCVDNLQSALADVENSLKKEQPLSCGWKDLFGEIQTIDNSIKLKTKLKEVLKWICDHPAHTYAKKVKGWINTIQTQFCVPNEYPDARDIVDYLVKLKIVKITVYRSANRSRYHPQITSRTIINKKRCREETINNYDFDTTNIEKKKKI